MEIKTKVLGHIGTNCYLISSGSSAIVIDPGFYSEEIENFLTLNQNKERIILLTHAHFDHISAADILRKSCNVKIAIGERENIALSDQSVNLSERFHAHIDAFSADLLLTDGEIFSVGDITIKVIFTPGHTVGSVCYLIDNKLFSGDTLFFESIGRTDFPGGDFSVLSNSVKSLYTLSDNIEVYPGHGPCTTISHEKMFNPFVKS